MLSLGMPTSPGNLAVKHQLGTTRERKETEWWRGSLQQVNKESHNKGMQSSLGAAETALEAFHHFGVSKKDICVWQRNLLLNIHNALSVQVKVREMLLSVPCLACCPWVPAGEMQSRRMS